MKSNIKTLAATAVLGAATIAIYSDPGFAASSTRNTVTATQLVPATMPAIKLMKARRVQCHTLAIHHLQVQHGAWNLGLRRNKHLTAHDAHTITAAALLMRGHHNLRVGDMHTTTSNHGHKFYLINIVNKKNKVVSRVIFNSRTGHIQPLHVRQSKIHHT